MPRIPSIRTIADTADTLMLVVAGTPYMLDSSHPRFTEIAALANEFVQPANFADHEAELTEADQLRADGTGDHAQPVRARVRQGRHRSSSTATRSTTS